MRSSVAYCLSVLLLLALAGAFPNSAYGASVPRVFAWEETLRGTEEVHLRWPVAVASPSAEEFAVADVHGPRVLLFRKVGVSWQLDSAIDLPGAPVDIVHDGQRYLVSLRQGQGLLSLEGPQLLQRKVPLPDGVVPGPMAVLADGSFLLFDFAGQRVLTLDTRGTVGRDIAIGKLVTGLAAAPAGGFFAAVGEESEVLAFTADGRKTDTWAVPGEPPVPAWPSGLATEPGGDVVVVDRHGGRLLIVELGGVVIGQGARQGWEAGLLLYPGGVERMVDGRWLVADQGNGRVQIFRRTDKARAQ